MMRFAVISFIMNLKVKVKHRMNNLTCMVWLQKLKKKKLCFSVTNIGLFHPFLSFLYNFDASVFIQQNKSSTS